MSNLSLHKPRTFTKLQRKDVAKLGFFSFFSVGAILVLILTPNLLPSTLLSTLVFFIFVPLVNALERKGVPRTYAILGVFFFCGLALAWVASWATPLISKEVDTLQCSKLNYGAHFFERLKIQEKKMLENVPLLKDAGLTEKAFRWVQGSTVEIWKIVPQLASHFMLCIFLVPFLSFILLKDAHAIRRSLLALVPNRYFETIYGLLSRILEEMGGYVAARILEAALVTIMVTLGCLAVGIPHPFLLGIFAGATNPIPYLGPLFGALPALLFAILDPVIPNQLLWIGLIFAAANIIDMMVIFPLMVAKIVNLHPVIVVISVILGAQLFGILGMILAVPATSILKIFLQELYSRVYDYDSEIPSVQ